MVSFLDYYKMILDKVSFDHVLLNKEYQKAKRNLQAHEVGDLNRWLRSKGYHGILNEKNNLAAKAESFGQQVFS